MCPYYVLSGLGFLQDGSSVRSNYMESVTTNLGGVA